MRVVFSKAKRELCWWTAYPPKRRPISALGGTGHARIRMPHDLAQFIVERQLGYRHGFWGCVADGASFRTLVPGGRKRTRPGIAVLAAHVAEVEAAEHDFHRHVELWLNHEPTPAQDSLDHALELWQGLAEHESFDLDFPPTARTRVAGSRSRHGGVKPATVKR